jgi:hypothetical protein
VRQGRNWKFLLHYIFVPHILKTFLSHSNAASAVDDAAVTNISSSSEEASRNANDEKDAASDGVGPLTVVNKNPVRGGLDDMPENVQLLVLERNTSNFR